jgi:hypothetical protein
MSSHDKEHKSSQNVEAFISKISYPHLPERFLTGDVSLKELLAFLKSHNLKSDLTFQEYIVLADWITKLADAMDIDA